MLGTLCKIFSRRNIEIFSYFPKKIGFDISDKLSPWKNKKDIINLSSAQLTQGVVKVT